MCDDCSNMTALEALLFYRSGGTDERFSFERFAGIPETDDMLDRTIAELEQGLYEAHDFPPTFIDALRELAFAFNSTDDYFRSQHLVTLQSRAEQMWDMGDLKYRLVYDNPQEAPTVGVSCLIGKDEKVFNERFEAWVAMLRKLHNMVLTNEEVAQLQQQTQAAPSADASAEKYVPA